MYTLEAGDTSGNRLGKNYKNFGIMGVLQMTDAQKEVEGNYNQAVIAANTKLSESFSARGVKTTLETELAALKADQNNVNREADIAAKEEEIST